MPLNRVHLQVVLRIAIALAVVASSEAQSTTSDHPCEGDCRGDFPACENAWRPNISAVFLGRATRIQEEEVPISLDGKKALTGRLFVKIDVEEAFIGVPEERVTISSGGDLCGFPFSKGHDYLVYGRRLSDGNIYVSLCMGTKWKSRSADDLKYLRSLPTAPKSATIYGSVFRYTSPAPRTMAGRLAKAETGNRVEIQGPNRIYEAFVHANGNFKVSDLPPGTYTIKPNVNAGDEVYTSPPGLPTTVTLAEKACAQFDFRIDPFAKKESGTSQSDESPVANPR
jgi:hypothetical protein